MKFRKITVLLAASALSLGLAFSTAGPAAASCGGASDCPCATGTCIWAGWGVTGQDLTSTGTGKEYTSISGEFTVPAVKGSAGNVAFWYGLGGVNTALEQTGVAVKIVHGQPVYQGFWELTPSKPVFYTKTVRPGDFMAALVNYSSSPSSTGGTYRMFLRDVTRGWSEDQVIPARSHLGTTSRDAAEAIVENVQTYARKSPNPGPLPDFGTIRMDNIAVDNSYGWTQFNYGQSLIEWTLGTGKVYISPLQRAGDFTVTWEHS